VLIVTRPPEKSSSVQTKSNLCPAVTFNLIPGLLISVLAIFYSPIVFGGNMKKFFLLISFGLLNVLLFAQSHEHQPSSSQSDLEATTQAMGHGHHHDDHDAMGAHMHMTELRAAQPGDQVKAQKIVEQARQALEKYRDYKVALNEGFRIFLPNVPQPMYHFTNFQYAIGASFGFDATKPTSLLYEKNGDGYKLIGAMYTAPVRFTEDQIMSAFP